MTLPDRRDTDRAGLDPFREMEALRSRINELMEGTFGSAAGMAWEPPVDIEETDDAFVVEAELPGVKRQDIDVELEDNQLRIRGEVKERERVGILRRRTRRTGEFNYRVSLPGDFDSDKVEAQLDEGILTVRVPKLPAAQKRRIAVRHG